MTDHPTPAALRSFLAGELSREEARRIVRHLIPGCEQCGAEVAATARFLRATEAGRVPEEGSEADIADIYEAPLQRAFAAVRLHGTWLPDIKKQTARALALFEKRGPTGPAATQQGDVPVYEAALARCQALRHEDPQGMINHALIALQISRRLDKKGYTAEQAADFQARALGEFANAHRVADRICEAEDIMSQAFRYAAAGTGDRFISLRLKELKASLHRAQHRYGEAVQELSEIHESQLLLGDVPAAARTLINKAVCLGYLGELELSLRFLDRASAMADEAQESGLKATAVHNKLLFLAGASHWVEALELLESKCDLLCQHGGSLGRWKLRDIEGRIYAGMGRLNLAETAFQEAKGGFREAKVHGHEAIVGLDLAAVVMRQGRHREGLLYAAEALQEFTRLKLADQVAEALLVLAEAITQRLVTATLVQSVADFVRKAEHDPQVRYEPRFE